MAVRKDSIQVSVDIEAAKGVRAYQSLLDQAKSVNNEMRKLKKNGKENTEEFKKLESQAANLNQELGKLGGQGANFAQLISRSKQLNRELKSLVPGTQRFIQVSKELKQVNSRIAEIRKGTKGVATGLDEMRIAGLKVPKVITGISTAFNAFIALAVVQYFMQLFQIVDETTKQFAKLRGEISRVTGETGDAVDNYASRISAIALTFGKETDEVLNSANSLTKQLTGDFSESLRLIEQGFLSGADRGGDFLDIVKEYPAFFREAGLNGEQFISLISQGVQEGVFSDKSIDLVKEFTLRIRELPKATKTALNSIGISSQQIRKEIEENGIGAAFTLVQTQLNKLEDDAPEVGAALADIFGGPGEDAGIQFIKTLDLTGDALDNLIDKENEYTQATIDQLQANQELSEAQVRLSKGFDDTSNSLSVYITRIKAFLFEVAADVLQFFEQLPATANGVRAAFTQVLENISNFFERTRLRLAVTVKQIEKLNPFGKTSEQLDQEISDLRNKREALKTEVGSVAEAYRDAFLEGLENVETRKQVSEALTPKLDEETVRNRTKEQIKKVDEIRAEELRKIKAERTKDKNLLAPLDALGTTAASDQSVESDGSAEVSTSAQEELLKNQFLKALITEQEYEEQRFLLAQEAYERRLAFLREKHGEESAAFVKLENEKLTAQKEYEEQRSILTAKTEETRDNILLESGKSLNQFVDNILIGLGKEDAARKKNSLALKAFSAGKVVVDTQEAIMAIIKNAEANPANIFFPGAGKIISAVKIANILAQSGRSLSKIRGTSFYDGGFTGNKVLVPDAHGGIVGGVHKNEWVAPAWQTKHPEYGPIINWLDTVRQRGYKDGGFVNVDTTTTAPNAGQSSALIDTSNLEQMMSEVRDSNREIAMTIKKKQFSVMSGQIVDALDEESRLNAKAAF